MTSRRRTVVLACGAAALVAALAVAVSVSRRPDDDPPWDVWAVMPSVQAPQFSTVGRVAGTPGGAGLDGRWTTGIGRAPDDLLWFPEPTLIDRARRRLGQEVGHEACSYAALRESHTAQDGALWTHLVRVPDRRTLAVGAKDARAEGAWELTDARGASATLELLPGGRVRGFGWGGWASRDGAVMVVGGGLGDGVSTYRLAAVLGDDGATLAGWRQQDRVHVTGRRVVR